MRNLLCAIISMLLVVTSPHVNATLSNPDDPLRSKTFSRSFTLEVNDKVRLTNKYGEMQIKTWDKKELKVDIEIKAYSKDEADAQRLIDETVIEADKHDDLVIISTVFPASGKYGSKVKNGKTLWRREVRVNYVIYMPASHALTLSNQYGNVNMGNFSGPLQAKVQYGNFTAGSLTGNHTQLEVQYGNSHIQVVKNARIKQQYGSGLTLGIAGALNLEAQYAGVNIGTVKGDATIKQQYGPGLNIGQIRNLDLNSQYVNVKIGTVNGNAKIIHQYNNLKIGMVRTIDLKTEYANVSIDKLNGSGNIMSAYNQLKLDEIGTGCKHLDVVSSYSHVSLIFNESYRGNFDLKSSYSPFKAGAGITSRQVGPDDKTKTYTGTIGSDGPANVSLKIDYGSLRLNQ